MQVVWPNMNDSTPVFIFSVDGTHCRINEPMHDRYSQDARYFSHKTHSAGLSYELGVSLYSNQLVWMNGPFPAGRSDMQIFRNNLLERIPVGKSVIADGGYRGKPQVVSVPNNYDDPDLRKFKRRARCRQETFNARLKNFRVLDNRFCQQHQKQTQISL